MILELTISRSSERLASTDSEATDVCFSQDSQESLSGDPKTLKIDNYPNEDYMKCEVLLLLFKPLWSVITFYIVQMNNKLLLFKPLCPIPSHSILSK
jgi:hypothetical protein